MILGSAHVELRMARIVTVGVRGFPVVMPEVRLREADQHADVVGRPENFREADVRAGLAAVIVCVNEVDSKALEALHRFDGARVTGRTSAELGVVEWDRGEKEARAVEVKILAVDPELAKAETYVVKNVQRLAV